MKIARDERRSFKNNASNKILKKGMKRLENARTIFVKFWYSNPIVISLDLQKFYFNFIKFLFFL